MSYAKKTPSTMDLFDRIEYWFASPIDTFLAWISSQNLAYSSQVVRISMWNKFIRWLTAQGVTIDHCCASHISDFLVSAGLDKEQAWRYVILIEQVYDHLKEQGLDMPNPGRQAGKVGVENSANAPMRFLNPWERDSFLQVIQPTFDAARSDKAFATYQQLKPSEQHKVWAKIRDAAIAGLMIGGGVKVSELAKLSIDCDFTNQTLDIMGNYGLHQAPLFPIAMDALTVWLPYRKAEKGLGDILFPAMIYKRRNDQSALASSLHPANIFRRLKALFHQAGLTNSRTCGQTLRNTYAAQLIESGAEDANIIEALGFKEGGEFTVPRLRYDHNRAMKIN